MAKPLPSVKSLRSRVEYCPDTGVMRWLGVPSGNGGNRHKGKDAFNTINGAGYRQGMLDGVHILAHRAAWAIHYGEWPPSDMLIDHIDGNKSNNSIRNLRLADRFQNRWNAKNRPNKQSGYTGVTWCASKNKWRAQITNRRITHHIGYYKCEKEAAAAYLRTLRETRGEFSNIDTKPSG